MRRQSLRVHHSRAALAHHLAGMDKDGTAPIARGLARSLDAATYAGYRAGFEAAREEAALLAERAGQALLAARLRAMRPLPRRREGRQ